MMPPTLSCAFPVPPSFGVKLPLLAAILGRKSFKTTAPSLVPSTHCFAQPLEEGLLASRAALYTVLSLGDTSSHRIPPLNFSWGDSGCSAYETPTPVDTCQVPRVTPMLPIHQKWGRSTAPPPLQGREVRGSWHSTSSALFRASLLQVSLDDAPFL